MLPPLTVRIAQCNEHSVIVGGVAVIMEVIDFLAVLNALRTVFSPKVIHDL